jgi:hypothetical protein
MYALAAGAAGVSLLALTQPADAKIVYTSAHIGLDPRVSLDLNHDGQPDFYFLDRSNYGKGTTFNVFAAVSGNQVWGAGNLASALVAGVRIGPKGKFQGNHSVLDRVWRKSDTGTFYTSGKWQNTPHHYLGLKFVIAGKIHFGWARLDMSVINHAISGLLTGYAYETIPGKPIIAGNIVGETKVGGGIDEANASRTSRVPSRPNLGVLALGSSGLSIWRREEAAGAAL